MRPTVPENKVVRPEKTSTGPEKTPTEELEVEFNDDEITAVNQVIDHHTNFSFSDKDMEMVMEVSKEKGISYDAALHLVLRDALDLYHWNHKRPI